MDACTVSDSQFRIRANVAFPVWDSSPVSGFRIPSIPSFGLLHCQLRIPAFRISPVSMSIFSASEFPSFEFLDSTPQFRVPFFSERGDGRGPAEDFFGF